MVYSRGPCCFSSCFCLSCLTARCELPPRTLLEYQLRRPSEFSGIARTTATCSPPDILKFFSLLPIFVSSGICGGVRCIDGLDNPGPGLSFSRSFSSSCVTTNHRQSNGGNWMFFRLGYSNFDIFSLFLCLQHSPTRLRNSLTRTEIIVA